MSLKERMDRWIDYAKAMGIHIERVLIHPSDLREFGGTDLVYRGLPVEPLGGWPE